MVHLRSKDIALAGILAALYAVVTIATYPISYLLWNVRVSDILIGLIFFYPLPSILALWLGGLIANMTGPVGPLDVLGSFIGVLFLYLAYIVGKRNIVAGLLVNWLLLSAWLSFMLHIVLSLDIMATAVYLFPQVFISDVILPFILYKALKKYGFVEAWKK